MHDQKPAYTIKLLITRIVTDLVVLFFAFAFPWWSAIVLAVILSFVFGSYLELVVVALIIDSIYAYPGAAILHFHYWLTLICLVLFLAFNSIKKRLR